MIFKGSKKYDFTLKKSCISELNLPYLYYNAYV